MTTLKNSRSITLGVVGPLFRWLESAEVYLYYLLDHIFLTSRVHSELQLSVAWFSQLERDIAMAFPVSSKMMMCCIFV
jgi:hypothetical protein